MEKIWTSADIANLSRIPRMNLVNSLSGFKSANLIGTSHVEDGKKIENLALFSSLVHIGADPALIGLVFRPIVSGGKTSRHSYENIHTNKFFTINQVHSDLILAAHQCSASYERGESEFLATGLTPQYVEHFSLLAPFVAQSRLKMGCSFVEQHEIAANNTIFMVAKIEFLLMPEHAMTETGHLNLDTLETVAVEGLDTYHAPNMLKRLPYARP